MIRCAKGYNRVGLPDHWYTVGFATDSANAYRDWRHELGQHSLLRNAQAKGTLASADNGAYAMGSTDNAYVGNAYALTSIKGWKNNAVGHLER